jgi:DNA polymerase-1
MKSRERIAIDTETDGLQWARGNKPFMATFCADYDKVYATYEPEFFAKVFEAALPVTQIYHNAKFDLHMIGNWLGKRPEDYFELKLADTMQAFRIQYPLDSARLKVAANRYLEGKVDVAGPQAAVKKWISENSSRERINKKWITTSPSYDMVPPEIMLPYATQDVWMTQYCHDRLAIERGSGPEKRAQLYLREVLLVKLLLHCEYHGWPVNYDSLMLALENSATRFDAAMAVLEEMAPGLNIASTPQLRKYLYETLGEPIKHRVKVKKNLVEPGPSTDETTLLDLNHKEEGGVILDVRHWKRTRDKYNELALYLTPNSTVHSDLKQERAKTGRFGSSKPALQNLPNAHGSKDGYDFCSCHKGQDLSWTLVRDVFQPPPGYEWLYADYSQIEMRIFAHYCRDPYLVEAIIKGDDLHKLTAARMYGVSLDDVTKAMRAFGKIMNFTIIYGGGRNKIATALREGSAQNDPLTLEEAQRALLALMPEAPAAWMPDPYEPLAATLLKMYYKQFPDIKYFMNTVQNTIKWRWHNEGEGYVKNVFGRITPVDPERAYAGVNYIIQGTAADLLKDAMLNSWFACTEYAIEHNLTPWEDIAAIGTIHDELIFQVRAGHAEALAKHLKPILVNWPMLSLPITVDFAHVPEGGSWARKKELLVA